MRPKTGLIKISCLIFLVLYLILPATSNAFYGFTNEPGSHIDLTETAFKTVFQSLPGRAFSIGTVPIYSIHYYRWKPNRAVDFLADASRDTDIYYFGLAYPHAQTRSYPIRRAYSKGDLEDIEIHAIFEYLNFMVETLEKTRLSYNAGDSRGALYRLGFYIHGYEDLFAHQGITNEQHIWLEKKGQNPDTNQKSIGQCRTAMIQLAKNLSAILGPSVGPEFQRQLTSTAEIRPTTTKERRRILGRNPDIYWEGIKYKLTSTNASCARYLDRIRWDYTTLARLLNSREALEEATRIQHPEALRAFLKRYGYKF
ncbi:MAG TPA: hypothetical protein VHY08_19015 [Bacillota bacterium]|nr:hypothetical protein [Bacillota bacterium]